MKRRFRNAMIVGVMGLMSINCMADSHIGILYNGEEMYLDQETKVTNNVVLLPLRAVSQTLGYEVKWDTAGKIEIKDGNYSVGLVIGSKDASVNGKKVTLEVTPKCFNGITYVPLRFIGEAMGMGVDWNGKTKQVELVGKYRVDPVSKKLYVREENGEKKVVAENIKIGDDKTPDVKVSRTMQGSELVSVEFMQQGALTTYGTTLFYIKNGKVMDKVVSEGVLLQGKAALVKNNQVGFSTGATFKVYDDLTGKLVKTYDLKQWLKEEDFLPMSFSEKYLVGRSNHTIHIIDLVSNKVTRPLDLIPETTEEEKMDKYYIYMDDMPLTAIDHINLVWETEDALVFKYHCQSTGEDKTITYRVGK